MAGAPVLGGAGTAGPHDTLSPDTRGRQEPRDESALGLGRRTAQPALTDGAMRGAVLQSLVVTHRRDPLVERSLALLVVDGELKLQGLPVEEALREELVPDEGCEGRDAFALLSSIRGVRMLPRRRERRGSRNTRSCPPRPDARASRRTSRGREGMDGLVDERSGRVLALLQIDLRPAPS